VEVGRGVPLRRLRLLVELHERPSAALVVPGENRVEVGLDGVNGFLLVQHARMLPARRTWCPCERAPIALTSRRSSIRRYPVRKFSVLGLTILVVIGLAACSSSGKPAS